MTSFLAAETAELLNELGACTEPNVHIISQSLQTEQCENRATTDLAVRCGCGWIQLASA